MNEIRQEAIDPDLTLEDLVQILKAENAQLLNTISGLRKEIERLKNSQRQKIIQVAELPHEKDPTGLWENSVREKIAEAEKSTSHRERFTLLMDAANIVKEHQRTSKNYETMLALLTETCKKFKIEISFDL